MLFFKVCGLKQKIVAKMWQKKQERALLYLNNGLKLLSVAAQTLQPYYLVDEFVPFILSFMIILKTFKIIYYMNLTLFMLPSRPFSHIKHDLSIPAIKWPLLPQSHQKLEPRGLHLLSFLYCCTIPSSRRIFSWALLKKNNARYKKFKFKWWSTRM